MIGILSEDCCQCRPGKKFFDRFPGLDSAETRFDDTALFRRLTSGGQLFLLFFILLFLFTPVSSWAAKQYKVLVVMSYEQDYPWAQAIRRGIDQVLAGNSEIRYFYMDTKKDITGGRQKGRQAFELYRRWRPDGVIAVDDNAQSMFVVPYLLDKVDTPVMFCGVNADPQRYGYPGRNVSGILERLHIRESIVFASQLARVRTVCFLMKKSPVAALVRNQVDQEKETYPAKTLGFYQPSTLDEALIRVDELKQRCDLLFLETLEGIADAAGKPVTSKEIVPLVVKAFGGPTAGSDLYSVQYGVLCSVIKSGEEQGETAATMLLQAMSGAPVAEIPITRNYRGKRVLNVTTMKNLGIRARPMLLRGTQLIRTTD